MITTIEYEKKYELTNEQRLELISHLGNYNSTFHQVDRYYDAKDAILYCRGIFMRIRGDRFQVKFNLQDVVSGKSSGHTECTELDFPLIIPKSEQVELRRTLSLLGVQCPDDMITPFALFEHQGLIESVVIDKVRSVYRLTNYTISLDEVAGLGNYVEIESATKDPMPTGKELGLFSFISERKPKYIDTGYNALYWRMHNREIYLKSPYVMESDKNNWAIN